MAALFAQVWVVCDRQGLIGREMFAIDGVKLPSNASKAKSGTRKDYQRQLSKMETAAQKIVAQHCQADTALRDAAVAAREARKLARLHTTERATGFRFGFSYIVVSLASAPLRAAKADVVKGA